MSLNDLKFLRQQISHAKYLINTIDYELEREINDEGFLVDNAKALAQFLRGFLSTLETHIDFNYHLDLIDLKELDPQAPETKKALGRVADRIIDIIRIASELMPLYKFVNGARAMANPWALVAQIDRFCRNLNPRARVIIRPRWENNYSHYPISRRLEQISGLSENINAATADLRKALDRQLNESDKFFSLSFPPTSNPNLIQMAIWGHEIGHFVDRMKSPAGSSEALSGKVLDKVFPAEKIPPPELSSIDVNDEIAAEQINKEVKTLLVSKVWAREFFSDAFGLRCFGPATIFALVNLVLPSQGLDNSFEHYPPLKLRLRLLFKQYNKIMMNERLEGSLKNESFEITTKALNDLEKLIIELEDNQEDPNKFTSIVHRNVEVNFDDLSDTLFELTDQLFMENKSVFFQYGDYKFVDQCLTDLYSDVPPYLSDINPEEREAFQFRSLSIFLNSGWAFLLKEGSIFDGDEIKLEDYENFEQLQMGVNKLLLMGLEGTEARQWFNERKKFCLRNRRQQFK